MRNLFIVLSVLLWSITSVDAQVSVGIGLPGLSIGINLPVYPQLVPVPGYPVYYAPQLNSNYFFYDGMYWVYQGDHWYASSWYNGPWALVAPEVVPLYVLRIPVRYYRQPPVYFRGWASNAPPRWGEHWGSAWEQHHSGWDNWNRSAVPAPAPLPAYQRQYSGDRYPPVARQQVLQSQNYRYQPQDAVVQQHYQAQRAQSAPAGAPPTARGQPRPSGGVSAQGPVTGQAPSQQAGATSRHPQQPTQGAVQQQSPQPQQAAARQPQQPSQGLVQQQAPHPQQAAARHPQQPTQGAVQQQAPQPQQAAARQPQQPSQGLVQQQAPHPQQAATRQPQQASRSQDQEKAPQGKQPAEESRQTQEKGHDKRD